MTTRGATSMLPLAIAAGLGFLGGALGGAVFAAGRTPPPAAAAEPDLTAVVDELRGLRRDLQNRSAASHGTAGMPQPVRELAEAAPTAAPDLAQLTAVVTQLVQVVDTLATRADALGAQQAAGRGVLAQVASRSSRDLSALAAVAKSMNTDRDAVQATWMFTPAAEVLRRFGPPKRIDGNGDSLQWVYEFEAEGDSWWLGFTIADGVVVRVD